MFWKEGCIVNNSSAEVMTQKPTQEFRVRLSRTSSAQAVLKKERKKGTFKVDDMIDDDRSTDTVTGKLPTEAAYVIMKRVTAEVGLPLNSAGISTYNKLQSLKTSPAVELLNQKTWREFFSKKTAAHISMAKNVNVDALDQDFALLNGTALSSTEDMHKRQSEMKLHLIQMFDRLVSRVEQLWNALKIPNADRVFYRKSLCKGPPQSVDQCREIAVYVAALKAHQDATVIVIQAIQMREMAIAKCFDVLAALQRKFSRTNQREVSLGGTAAGNSLRSSFNALSMNNNNNSNNHNRHELDGGAGSSFWKEELIVALDDVRGCSLEVIKQIQNWRRNLWRPHPFVYMGVNYVAKMKDDLSILESDIYIKLLALVPIKLSDLQCIVFFSNAGKIFVDTAGSLGHTHPSNTPTAAAAGHPATAPTGFNSNNSSNPASPVRPPPYPTSFSDSSLQQSGRHGANTGHNGHNGHSPAGEQFILQLLQEFLHKVHPKELHLAATIVLDEEMLQNALSIEHASLLSKGVFIPTVHTHRGGKLGAEKVVQRSSGNGGGNGGGGAMNDRNSFNSTLEQADVDFQADRSTSSDAQGFLQLDIKQQQAPFSSKHNRAKEPSREKEAGEQAGRTHQGHDEEAVDWAPDFA